MVKDCVIYYVILSVSTNSLLYMKLPTSMTSHTLWRHRWEQWHHTRYDVTDKNNDISIEGLNIHCH